MENNRPTGRRKNVIGEGQSIHKTEQVNTGGPVGKQDGYQARKDQSYGTSGSGNRTTTRAGGKGGLIILLLVAALLIFGGGKLFNCGGLLGGLTGNDNGTTTFTTPAPTQSSQSNGFSGVLGSLMGGNFSNAGAVSTGWAPVQQDNAATTLNNTGTLNSTVANGTRDKYTQIRGNGSDVVTMMVYMCGTDLESKSSMATMDLQEMVNAAANNPNLNLLVYTGGCRQWKNNIVSSSNNQIYKVGNGGLACLVQNDGKDAMTKPATLTRFINYCTSNYPANRYELILWDHGGGSVSGYGYDEKYANSGSMSLKGIRDALSSANTTFDFIGFDACLMATLENALMLEPYADYLIASEETEPGVGWYYTNWLKSLNNNTSMSTLNIGKAIVDDFVSVCAQKCPGQKTTLSVVDLAELKATVPEKFNTFSTATANLIKSDYQKVANARNNTREFATSTKIDQIDLVHLAYNLNTTESKALADAILGAVKYNRTSSNMTNCYGLSIYFPYRKTSMVDSAVSIYNAIGLDSAYSRCIQQFAGMGVAGQAVGSTASYGSLTGASPLGSLLGSTSSGSGVQSSGDISSLLGSLLGGGSGSSGGSLLGSLLGGGSSDFFGRSIEDVDAAAQYIAGHQFDSSQLVWTNQNGTTAMTLSEGNWNMVSNLLLNVFVDDGEGYIDLGLDNVYEFTKEGALVGEYDNTWLGIDGQVMAYYFLDCVDDGSVYTITGRVPCLLNGDRADLILVYDNDAWTIAGAKFDYVEGETDTIAKSLAELEVGDKIDLLCDYYSYEGDYQNSYKLGEQIIYTGNNVVGDYRFSEEKMVASYMFTDIYSREYWTPTIPVK